ncbi:hypothetical protein [Streptomyces sp. NPDC101150]|uniref:hypothetical protein n=1 Tax=Streptomyces sp. NPDC101150 TaxID=3366114 RepID=UPI0037FA752D
MSGTHARPQPAISVPVWRPIVTLAALGLAPPAAIVAGAAQARSAPAVSVPDIDLEAAGVAHTTPEHPCRCGTRSSP